MFKSKELKDTTIKVELRNRIYSSKMKEYKLIFMPHLLEVSERHLWKDVVGDVQDLLQKLYTRSVIESSPEEKSTNVIILSQK